MGGHRSLDLISGAVAAGGWLDQTNDLIAVLDGDGVIVLTNAAWRTAADQRGADSAAAGCGVNYVKLCRRSDAATVAAEIQAVLVGDRPRFELEYPCHSSVEDAWYEMEVLPLRGAGSGAVVTHTNISASAVARRGHGHGRQFDPVTTLATSPSQVAGLARMLANAQLRGSSLAVVTITLPELFDFELRRGRRSRDALVVQVVSRVLRFVGADDALIRPSTNELVLYASVADAQAGEFLRERISQVLGETYLVGENAFHSPADVAVVSSDQFSVLDHLTQRSSLTPDRLAQHAESPPGHATSDANQYDESNPPRQVPLVVYSLPDGVLQAANASARSLIGLQTLSMGKRHAGDIASPIDLTNSVMALRALSSGAAESYRAQRTLVTPDGPLQLLTAVRRLLVDSGALAVALTVPVDLNENSEAPPAADDPFATALIAGTITAHGALTSVSVPHSPVETEVAGVLGALDQTLQQAAHPDDAELVDHMLQSLRSRGDSAGEFRLAHPRRGWMLWQCQLFTMNQHKGHPSETESQIIGHDSHVFVLSAMDDSTKSMVDKIARLERHIRRIGSEVLSADLEPTARPPVERVLADALDELGLTARQRDIVERLARGQRVATIAAALYISRSTVRNHLAQVFRMAGVHSQEELLNKLGAS